MATRRAREDQERGPDEWERRERGPIPIPTDRVLAVDKARLAVSGILGRAWHQIALEQTLPPLPEGDPLIAIQDSLRGVIAFAIDDVTSAYRFVDLVEQVALGERQALVAYRAAEDIQQAFVHQLMVARSQAFEYRRQFLETREGAFEECWST